MERYRDIQAHTHTTICLTHIAQLVRVPGFFFFASIAAVGALPCHCDENACFINFVTKSMHSIVQQGRQSGGGIPMNSRCCVAVSPPENIRERHAGKNNPQLNLHHLSPSAHRIISFPVNNSQSTLSHIEPGHEHAKGLRPVRRDYGTSKASHPIKPD